MRYRLWTRHGEMPFVAPDFDAAMTFAVSHAARRGVYVVLLNQDREILAEIPPALQTSHVDALLFSGAIEAEGLFDADAN